MISGGFLNMKKGLFVTTLVACSALLLAGCASEVSLEDAKKHCDENFTSTEVKTFDVHMKNEVKKVSGVFESAYKVGVEEQDATTQSGVVSSSDLDYYGDAATYKVDGKALIITIKADVKEYVEALMGKLPEDAKVSGEIYEEVKTDDAGYPASSYGKMELDIDFAQGGISIKGYVLVESTMTFKAK